MSLADAPSPNAITAGVAAAYAGEDARTNARLDWLVKVGGRCRACGTSVSDAGLIEHPGVCSACFRRKKVSPLVVPSFTVETSAPALEDHPMPCSVCGTAGHNARGCSKRSDPKKAPPAAEQSRPAKPVALPRPPPSSRAPTDFGARPLEQLLADRKAAFELINQVDAELVRRRDEIQRALGQAGLSEDAA